VSHPTLCQLQTELATGEDDGYRFFIRSNPDGWWLEAEPSFPGLTGSMTEILNQAGQGRSLPTPGADQARRRAFDLIRTRAALTIGQLFELEPTLGQGVQGGLPETILEAIGSFDMDGNTMVSYQEILDSGQRSSSLPAVQQWFDFARAVLKVGAGNELPAVQQVAIGDFDDGDPRGLYFDFGVQAGLTQLLVEHHGQGRSLSQLLRIAGRSRNPELRRKLVGLYLVKLRRLVHHDVTRAGSVALENGVANTLLLANP
jgi:hypothetical protein